MTTPTNVIDTNTGPRQRAQGYAIATSALSTDTDTNPLAVFTATTLTLTLGFVPTYVRVQNVTEKIFWEWYKGMNSGDYLETTAAGAQSLETDDKLTVSIRTGTGGLKDTRAGGSADTAASGVVVITFSDLSFSNSDTLAWVAEG